MKFERSMDRNGEEKEPVSDQINSSSKKVEENLQYQKDRLAKTPKLEGKFSRLRHPIQTADRRRAEERVQGAEVDLEEFNASIQEYMDEMHEEANQWREALKEYDATQQKLEVEVGSPAVPASTDFFFREMDHSPYPQSTWLGGRFSNFGLPEDATPQQREEAIKKYEMEKAKKLGVFDYFRPDMRGLKSSREEPSEVEFAGQKYQPNYPGERFPRMELGTDNVEEAIAKAEKEDAVILVMSLGDESKWRSDYKVVEKYVVVSKEMANLIRDAKLSSPSDSGGKEVQEIGLYNPGQKNPSWQNIVRTLEFQTRILSSEELRQEKEPINVTLSYEKVDSASRRTTSESTTFNGSRKEVQENVEAMSKRSDITNPVVEIGGQKVPWEEFINGVEQAQA